MIYVATADADAAAAKAARIGGAMMAPPFDVYDLGRMSVLRDPAGAVFAVWQAKTHAGLGVKNSPGALCWADLNTPDAGKAEAFYGGLFGWKSGRRARFFRLCAYQERRSSISAEFLPPLIERPVCRRIGWLIFRWTDCDATASRARCSAPDCTCRR